MADAQSENLDRILNIARDTLGREAQRGQRLEAKASGQATLAVSWFIATQAVVALSLGATTPRGWLVAVMVLLFVQSIALALLLLGSREVWLVQTRNDVVPETLDVAERAVIDGDPDFARRVIGLYRDVLVNVQATTAARAQALQPEPARLRSVPTYWYLVLAVGPLEMLTGLLARVAHG